MAMNPIDFEPRAWVPDSGWPITYDEVARHCPRAYEILELPNPNADSESLLAGRMSASERSLFESGVLAPTASLRPRSATRFGSAFGPMLRKSDGVNVVLNASATHVGLDEAGSAIDSVTAATLDGRRIDVRARRFVPACGGLENARLLLASRDRAPGGIANDHDVVGRYFMDHPRAVFGKIHVPPGTQFPLLRGRPLADGKFQFGVGLSPRTQAREQLLNHYATFELETSGYAEGQYQSFVPTMKVCCGADTRAIDSILRAGTSLTSRT